MLSPYTFSTSSQVAIHNLLKAWDFQNRAVLHSQRMLMAQQMMNKPVSDPLSKVIKIVARHREQTPDLRSKCRRQEVE
jgi:hypothetical protein